MTKSVESRLDALAEAHSVSLKSWATSEGIVWSLQVSALPSFGHLLAHAMPSLESALDDIDFQLQSPRKIK